MATTLELRTLTGWPDEVPEAMLVRHLAAAARDLARDTGLEAAPAGLDAQWEDAHCYRAAALAAPHLHGFVLSGAARVARLEGNVEWRFMTPAEVAAQVDGYMARYGALCNEIRGEATNGASDAFLSVV